MTPCPNLGTSTHPTAGPVIDAFLEQLHGLGLPGIVITTTGRGDALVANKHNCPSCPPVDGQVVDRVHATIASDVLPSLRGAVRGWHPEGPDDVVRAGAWVAGRLFRRRYGPVVPAVREAKTTRLGVGYFSAADMANGLGVEWARGWEHEHNGSPPPESWALADIEPIASAVYHAYADYRGYRTGRGDVIPYWSPATCHNLRDPADVDHPVLSDTRVRRAWSIAAMAARMVVGYDPRELDAHDPDLEHVAGVLYDGYGQALGWNDGQGLPLPRRVVVQGDVAIDVAAGPWSKEPAVVVAFHPPNLRRFQGDGGSEGEHVKSGFMAAAEVLVEQVRRGFADPVLR